MSPAAPGLVTSCALSLLVGEGDRATRARNRGRPPWALRSAGQTARVGNGVGAEWPQELAAVFERSLTVEYGSLTRSGKPVTVPVSPYVGRGGLTLDVPDRTLFPAKADRARGNPKVCLLFADPIGGGMRDMPVVLVQGHAAVRDADLQGNTDRAVALTVAKISGCIQRSPASRAGRMAYYFARIWVRGDPLHIRLVAEPILDIAPDRVVGTSRYGAAHVGSASVR